MPNVILCFKHKTYLRVEKTSVHVEIKNKGNSLYKKTFGEGDGNCKETTSRVNPQVWDAGSLSLAVNSKEGPCNLELNFVIFISCLIRIFLECLNLTLLSQSRSFI